MSTRAEALLEQIKALPPEVQREVAAKVLQREQGHGNWEEQKVKLRQMQARHAGRGLRDRLLQDRAMERARG